MSGAELSIELLERLATRGEIDPWDVDVVDAMDRCLESLDATDRQDLRLCGRALHCATILLRLKAEAMGAELDELLAPPAAAADDDWVDFEALDDDLDSDDERISPMVLDLALVRRSNARQMRRRRVTLAELVAELRKMEKETAAAAPKANVIRRASLAELRAKTVGLAHDEDLDGDARRLAEHLTVRFASEPELKFSGLVSHVLDDRGTFLALMFLAHWGVLELQQDALYSDILVRKAAESAAPTGPVEPGCTAAA
ncbi:MAG: segregation/condensation protein A [Cyanobacteria bacterium REEB65]|nr:segregation/condensation protein A [Cyanobacteria bacterium REEB65]